MGGALSGDWPWERPLAWTEVPPGERTVTLAPSAETRAAIARDLGLEGLARLEARLTLRPWMDGVALTGTVKALATQVCGVSLDPFEVAVDEAIAIRIVPAGSPNAPAPEAGEVIIDLEADDPPDTTPGATIDLAGYVVEALALALDPFPRKPGAVFEPPETTGPISPFAALSRLSRPPS